MGKVELDNLVAGSHPLIIFQAGLVRFIAISV